MILFSLLKWIFLQTSAVATIVSRNQIEKEYDWIIIGAGSAGSVLAGRLSELPDETVLVLEAGRDENFITDIPLLVSYILATDYNWDFKTQPSESACLSMNRRRCRWSRGKALGGTSVVNYMVYNRGFKQDYDGWAALGNKGWSYKDVLPYFLKAENINVPELIGSPYYGLGGPVNLERPSWRSPLAEAFLESSSAEQYPIGYGPGLTPPGMSYILANTINGARQSSNKAYLRPHRRRSNLRIEITARVTRILIDPYSRQAHTVEFLKDGKTYRVKVKKEIILSAGSINTPQLLILSGYISHGL